MSTVGRLDTLHLRTGTVAALAAWVTGLVASVPLAGSVFGTASVWTGAVFFYDSHLVPLSPVGGGTGGGNAVVRMLGPRGLAVVALPAVLLVVSGAVLAWRVDVADLGDAWVAGASVTPAYLLLGVAGAVAFTGRFFGGVYRPNFALAAVAGVVFPLACGTLGGVLALGLRRLRARVADRAP